MQAPPLLVSTLAAFNSLASNSFSFSFNVVFQKVISFGARTIVVPGNFPMGCLPIYLTKFGLESEAGEFNENHCIWLLNSFATFHNDHLKKAIPE